MQQVERITATELKILEALATYRFLTPAQMMALEVSAAKRHLYATLRTLGTRRQAMVRSLDFGLLVGHGRLSRVYFLTPSGAELVEAAHRHQMQVQYPRTVHAFRHDYFHRVNCIDFQIALHRFAARESATVDFFYTYFDHGGKSDGKPHAKTRVTFENISLVPDAVFRLTAEDGRARLFSFEMCNGANMKNLDEKFTAYAKALEHGAIEQTFEYPHGVRALFVFDTERGLELARTRVARSAASTSLAPDLYLKTLPEVAENFLSGWRQIGGEGRVTLF